MRYEWRSVLEYDDHFRQLQALYGLPWVLLSHHMHTTRLIPIAKSGPGVFDIRVVTKESLTLSLFVLLLVQVPIVKIM